MKLTDKYIVNLNHLDKDKFLKYPGVQGLTLRVYAWPSAAKTWFYQYRPKGKVSVRIHTKKSNKVLELGNEMPVCRIINNQAHAFAAGGSFSNGLLFTLSLGCGTWGKNSIDVNLNYKHFLNIAKIVKSIKIKQYKLKDFFQDYCKKCDPKSLRFLNEKI